MWCGWWDSNPHAGRHGFLRPARLPFHHIRILSARFVSHSVCVRFCLLRSQRANTLKTSIAALLSVFHKSAPPQIRLRTIWRPTVRFTGSTATLTGAYIYEKLYPAGTSLLLFITINSNRWRAILELNQAPRFNRPVHIPLCQSPKSSSHLLLPWNRLLSA